MIYGGPLLDDVEDYIFWDKESRFCTLETRDWRHSHSERDSEREQEEAKFIVWKFKIKLCYAGNLLLTL